MCNLAYLYEQGVDGQPDYQEARKWYEQAAQYQYPRALCCLGYFYDEGLGVDVDLEKII